MKTKEIDKELVLKALVKMVSNKEVVKSYIKGNISLKTLKQKGIKLANPL